MRLSVAGREIYAYTGSRTFDAGRPTIVFVHGAASDHSVFALQSRYFAYHGSNVVALDLPGHGRSAGPALASVEAIAAWLVAVCDAIDAPQVALVGHSLGSLAVLECASRNADRVSKLALLAPAAPMVVSDDLLNAAANDEELAYALINGWSHSAGKQLGGNTLPGVWLMGNALRLMERTSHGVLSVDLVACNAYSNGVAAAQAVPCPTLVVLGARDIMAPPKSATALVAALKQGRSVTLPNTGHSLMAEQPDAVLDALRTFL
jgi:pimeloyl-ACP methyl ester carboxylesterase